MICTLFENEAIWKLYRGRDGWEEFVFFYRKIYGKRLGGWGWGNEGSVTVSGQVCVMSVLGRKMLR